MEARKQRTHYFKVGAWLDPREGQIFLASTERSGFIVSVTDHADSVRGHPKLYGALRRILEQAGCWPEEVPRERAEHQS